MKSKLQGATSVHRFYLVCTCYPVGANIVRPQHDRSLCRERPRTRLTITREHTVLPYGYAFADEFTYGAPRSYPRAPSLAAMPQFTLPHPAVASLPFYHFFNIFMPMQRKRAHNVRPAENYPFTVMLHFQFSIISISTRGLPAYPPRTR